MTTEAPPINPTTLREYLRRHPKLLRVNDGRVFHAFPKKAGRRNAVGFLGVSVHVVIDDYVQFDPIGFSAHGVAGYLLRYEYVPDDTPVSGDKDTSA